MLRIARSYFADPHCNVTHHPKSLSLNSKRKQTVNIMRSLGQACQEEEVQRMVWEYDEDLAQNGPCPRSESGG